MVFGPGERFVHVPLGRMVSPTGKWVIDVSDVRWERGLFPISTIATHVDLRVAGGSGKPVRLLDSFTDLNDELRPEVMWVGDGRICLVTPQIDGMSFRSGVIDGVHVDVHVLRWNQTGQPQKIDLKAMCGT